MLLRLLYNNKLQCELMYVCCETNMLWKGHEVQSELYDWGANLELCCKTCPILISIIFFLCIHNFEIEVWSFSLVLSPKWWKQFGTYIPILFQIYHFCYLQFRVDVIDDALVLLCKLVERKRLWSSNLSWHWTYLLYYWHYCLLY